MREGRKVTLGAVRSVYSVASDMDLMRAFYEEALEVPLAFGNRHNWCQFKAGGSVIVFDATDVAAVAQRIERLGGRHLSSRDMGSHGSVATFAGPENNLFQLHVRAGGSV
jgi:hypothetical protein